MRKSIPVAVASLMAFSSVLPAKADDLQNSTIGSLEVSFYDSCNFVLDPGSSYPPFMQLENRALKTLLTTQVRNSIPEAMEVSPRCKEHGGAIRLVWNTVRTNIGIYGPTIPSGLTIDPEMVKKAIGPKPG